MTAGRNGKKGPKKTDEQIKLAVDGQGDQKDGWGTGRLTGLIESQATAE